jgi:hypothetical protein
MSLCSAPVKALRVLHADRLIKLSLTLSNLMFAHSERSACIGSVFEARSAGAQGRRSVPPSRVLGSNGLIPARRAATFEPLQALCAE